MTSSKPYLVRAIYEWLIDNNLTPYLAVNANYEGVQVPEEHVEDGRIVLNISPSACRGLHLENDRIVFSARFSGQPFQIFAPPAAVLAIYSKENGRGMVFSPEDEDDDGGTTPPPAPTGGSEKAGSEGSGAKRKPNLTVVK